MYDFLVETLYAIYRNGFSVTALGAVVYVLLRQRRVKKRLKRYIPWLFEDESEVKGYIQNQHTIMENQKLIMKEMGLQWNAPTSMMLKSSTGGRKTSYTSSLAEVSAAQDAASRAKWSYTKSHTRRMKQMNKFKSRKFWMAVISALLVVANEGLDLGISSETVMTFAALIATFILGESAVDATRAKGKEQANDFETPIEPRL